MAMLARSATCDAALQDMDLLRRVVSHKRRFYHAAWARHDLAVPGSFALTPPDGRLGALRRDYEAMSVMLFREPPPLESILADLASLEERINGTG